MLKTTARQIRDKCIAGDLGQPIVCSAAIEQAISALPRTMFTVPRGQVLLITSVQTQTSANKRGLTLTPTNSPGPSFYGVQMTNEGGTPQWTFGFMSFIRNASVFDAATPSAQSAEPGNVEVWHPKYAIPVPGGFTVDLQATQGDFGNHGAVHGVLIDEGAALSMGYNVNADATKSRHGVVVSRGDSNGGSGEVVLAGRPGKHIRILDIHARVQPATNTINTVTLRQDTGGQTFYGISNSNVVDSVEQKFSPDEMFLGVGEGIKLFSTVDNQCSIVIHYEFVDPDDVPSNAFWGYLAPAKPTPSATAVVIGIANQRSSSQVFTLYYPRLGTTKTSPGMGNQHLLRGVAISVQKDAGAYESGVQNVEQTLFAISHGAAASQIQITPYTTQGNVQVTPTLFAGLPYQNVNFVDDGLNVACKPNDGSIWFQSIGLGNNGAALGIAVTAVASGTADILAWHSTIWGRTIGATFRNLPNRGD